MKLWVYTQREGKIIKDIDIKEIAGKNIPQAETLLVSADGNIQSCGRGIVGKYNNDPRAYINNVQTVDCGYVCQMEGDVFHMYGILLRESLIMEKDTTEFIAMPTVVELLTISKDNLWVSNESKEIQEAEGHGFYLHNYSWSSMPNYGYHTPEELLRPMLGKYFYDRKKLRSFDDEDESYLYVHTLDEMDGNMEEWGRGVIQWNIEKPLPEIKVKGSKKYCYIQRVDDYIVSRFFFAIDGEDDYEYMRIKVKENGVSVYTNFNVGWYQSDISDIRFPELDVVCKGCDMDVWELKLKYYRDICPKSMKEFPCANLMLALLIPGIDNLLKLKGGFIMLNTLVEDMRRYFANDRLHFIISNTFGRFRPNEASFARMVGVPQWVVDWLLKKGALFQKDVFRFDVIDKTKSTIGVDYFQHLDRASAIRLMEFVADQKCRRDLSTLMKLVRMYGQRNLCLYMDKLNELEDLNDPDEMMAYDDYIAMLFLLGEDQTRFPWNLKPHTGEIQRLHDVATTMHNLKENASLIEEVREGFDVSKEGWEQYRYSSDGLVVIPPKEPMDIINEGLALHHCVKTYLHAVSNGETNILFIRNVEEEDKPFFTLEIKDNKIRQCHGFGNCVVTPEVDAFLKKFCEEKGVIYDSPDRILAVG